MKTRNIIELALIVLFFLFFFFLFYKINVEHEKEKKEIEIRIEMQERKNPKLFIVPQITSENRWRMKDSAYVHVEICNFSKHLVLDSATIVFENTKGKKFFYKFNKVIPPKWSCIEESYLVPSADKIKSVSLDTAYIKTNSITE